MNILKKIYFWLMETLFDCNYLVNFASKEIHYLDKQHHNCHIFEIKKFHLIKEENIEDYIKKGFNGCRYCLKEYDLG